MYRSTKKKMVKRVGISAVVALGAIATGAGVASASTTTVKGSSSAVSHALGSRASAPAGAVCAMGPGGVVSALTSSSITVTDPSGTPSTFAVTSSTTVTKERATASISDLAVGEQVRIIPTAQGSTTAQSIEIEQPSLMGQVNAVSGDTISISGPNGTSETVVVSDATTYAKSGASATLADVTVGSSIFAQGTFASGSPATLDATTIGIGVPPHQGQPGDGAPGGPGPRGRGFGPGPSNAHAD
jgi:hypothetical protein